METVNKLFRDSKSVS